MLRHSSILTTLAIAATLAAPISVSAQDAKIVPSSKTEMQLSFAPLVKQSSGAVVNVYAERMVQRRASPFAGDPFFEQFFGQQFPNRTEKQSSLGSGVVASAGGLVVTNNHVIDGANDIKVAFSDGREFSSKVLLKDDRLDLAVLQIQSDEKFPSLKLADSDAVDVGDLVLAIGNPFGVGQTVTSGIVSALARNQVVKGDFGFFIQTDASINPGNSGGALMDMNGELIGINTAIFSRGGGSNGIGFAIPSNLVRVFLAAAADGAQTFERPFIGASFEPVTSDVAEALGLARARGALVVSVIKGGPAEVAGMEPGQVITSVNGIDVEHPDALGYRLTTAGIGKTADLNVIDKGKSRVLKLALDSAPETSPRDERLVEGRNPFAGATIANLSPKLADELRMPAETSGLVITEVKRGSPAGRVGFRAKDVVLVVNGTAAESTVQLEQLLSDNPGFWRIEIMRDGQRIRQFLR
jgi:Do/DeqQ family serine protease